MPNTSKKRKKEKGGKKKRLDSLTDHIAFSFYYSAACSRAGARVHGLRTQADTSLIVLHLRYLVLELTRKSEVSSRFPPSAYLRFIEKTIQAQSISTWDLSCIMCPLHRHDLKHQHKVFLILLPAVN